MEHKHEEGKFNFEFEENTSLEDKIRIIVNEQIIKPYSQKASKEAEDKEIIYNNIST